jgi:hypothetical protein
MPATRSLDPTDLELLHAHLALSLQRAVAPHTEYQERPLDWIVEKLGIPRETLTWSENEGYETHAWDGTRDPLVALLDGLAAAEDVGVESGNGVGKTFLAACITLWFLASFEDSIVVTIAPKEAQLKLHVWREIGRLFPRFQRHFPSAQLLDGKLRMKEGVEERETWAATAFVCGVGADETLAARAQGFHNPDMLLIFEETPGIHPAVMGAFEHTCTGEHNLRLALGNPVWQGDTLHEFCLSPGVRHIRASALDYPNVVTGREVVEGAVGRASIERRQEKYKHSPAILESRIRGISPKQAHGVALAYNAADHTRTWSDAALRHAVQQKRWPVYGGIDFGHWRFAFVSAVVDDEGRVHLVDELFSQREPLETRAHAIHEKLQAIGASRGTRIYGDSANQTDINELNRAFRRIGSPYHVTSVDRESKLRRPSVEKLNDLLGRHALTFRSDLGAGQKWRIGLGAASDGIPETGSRLLWELRRWRYPEPPEGQAQRQDPDDNTADGADAIAALRYMVMSYLRRAPTEEERERRELRARQVQAGIPYELRGLPPVRDRNTDYGLERLVALEARKHRQRGWDPRFERGGF